MRVSRSLKELSLRLQRVCADFLQREGREPAVSELAELTGCDASDISEALCAAQPMLSLTASDDDEGQIDVPVEAPDEAIIDLAAICPG